MVFFDEILKAPEDSIFRLSSDFASDAREHKVNLGVGAYKTEALKPFVLESVLEAEKKAAGVKHNKEYLPITGLPVFLSHSLQLVFGESLIAGVSARTASVQTVGGTGGLRLAGEFLATFVKPMLYMSDPTWANHQPTFTRAGMTVKSHPYYNPKLRGFDFDAMCGAIRQMPKGSAILLHACCHNPTGCDPTFEQWKELSALIKEQGVFPLFDFAYQGFGAGVEEDALAIRYFAEQGHEMIVVTSNSKNFGLYGERVGALFAVAADASRAQTILSQLKVLVRNNYSNPPTHGARIVATILETESLKKKWLSELSGMRERITGMRSLLAKGLIAEKGEESFGFLRKQSGMFSFSGLEKQQAESLKTEHGIYMTNDGRISICGLNQENIDCVIKAILSVL